MPAEKRTRSAPPSRSLPAVADRYVASSLCSFVPHSTFSIHHSAFGQCHTMTLAQKNVLAKRSHLKPTLEKDKCECFRLGRPVTLRFLRFGFSAFSLRGSVASSLRGWLHVHSTIDIRQSTIAP